MSILRYFSQHTEEESAVLLGSNFDDDLSPPSTKWVSSISDHWDVSSYVGIPNGIADDEKCRLFVN